MLDWSRAKFKSPRPLRRTALKPGGSLKRKKPIKQKSARQREIDYCDALLRQIVLLRDHFTCQRCGATPKNESSSPTRGIVLQAAHIYGKGAHGSMRYVLENVVCLCRDKCHVGWWHRTGFGREAASENAVRRWCIEKLGEARMARLDLMSATWKKKKVDLAAERLRLEQWLAKYTESPPVDPRTQIGRQ